MFWKRFNELTRTLSFRLGLWYASVFVISVIIMLWLVYVLLGAAINRNDRDVIEARLREYVAVYQQGGLPALRDWTRRINTARGQRMLFTRVIKPDGSVQMTVMPEDWSERDIATVEEARRMHEHSWIRTARNSDVDLTVAMTTMPDGTVLQVGRSSDSRSRLLAKFREVFAVLILPLAGLGLIGGMVLTNRMTQPVRSMVKAAAAIIDTGRMDVRVPVQAANDELRELAVLFNRMLECNEELVRALRDSLDNVAHDLRTPLARLRATLEDAITGKPQPSGADESIGRALEETDRVQVIIKTLMDVAQAEAGLMQLRLEETNINALVEDALDLYADVAEEKGLSIEKHLGLPCPVRADPARLRQVFANLLDNAVKYTPRGGRIFVATEPGAGQCVTTVRDTGVGISKSDLPRIWERLYRGDKSRSEHGLGLGLNLVRAIVEAHHGRVTVTSRPGEGAEFRVFIPAFAKQAMASSHWPNTALADIA